MTKLKLFILLLLVAVAPVASGQYNLLGDASTTADGCVALTPNQAWTSGSVWYNEQIDLSEPLSLEFYVNFGNNNENGAEGMAFVMQTAGNDLLGASGPGLGYQGFSPSFGVEFDTFQNEEFQDPLGDHVCFLRDGIVDHGGTTLSGTTNIFPGEPNAEDGEDHLVRLLWDPETTLLTLFVDCDIRLARYIDMVGDVFQGENMVYWGFTAATGANFNSYAVCLEEFYPNWELELEGCVGETVQLETPGNPNGTFLWSPTEGLDDPTSQTPTLEITSTTPPEYCCTYTALCGDVFENCVAINSYDPGEIDLVDQLQACSSDEIILNPTGPATATWQWQTGALGGNLLSDPASQNATVLGPGNYVVYAITGSATCFAMDSVEIIALDEPALLIPETLTLCEGTSAELDLGTEWDEVEWSDGTTANTLAVSEAGIYSVELLYGSCSVEAEVEVFVEVLPTIDLGEDAIICPNTSLVLDAGTESLWNDGSTATTLEVDAAGLYTASVSIGDCSVSDQILVSVEDVPIIDLLPDYTLCEGDNLLLELDPMWVSPTWNGMEAQSFTISEMGDVVVNTSYQNCPVTHTIAVDLVNAPAWTLEDETTLCEGAALVLDAGVTATWNDGIESNTLEVTEPGVYTANYQDQGCSWNKETVVVLQTLPAITFEDLYILCPNEILELDLQVEWDSLVWSDGQTGFEPTFTASGIIGVDAYIGPCASNAGFEVSLIELPVLDLGADIILCENETQLISLNQEVLWNGEVWADSYLANQQETVTAEIDDSGCVVSDELEVVEIIAPSMNLPLSVVLCEGDVLTLSLSDQWEDVLWSTGSNASSIDVENGGIFTASANYLGCPESEEVEVTYVDLPELDLGADFEYCSNEEVILETLVPVVWNGDYEGTSYAVEASGSIAISYEEQGCEVSDEIEVVQIDLPEIDLPATAILCEGETAFFNIGSQWENTTWNTGDFGNTILIEAGGIYEVSADFASCSETQNVEVQYIDLPEIELGEDFAFCGNAEVILSASEPVWWNDEVFAAEYLVQEGGWVYASYEEQGCSISDSVQTTEIEVPDMNLPNNPILCEGETLTISLSEEWEDILWTDGSTVSFMTVSEGGVYSVTASFGSCPLSEEVEVTFIDLPELDLGADIVLCGDEEVLLNAGVNVLWNNGTESENYVLSTTELVTAYYEDSGCVIEDELNAIQIAMPTIDLGEDVLDCSGEAFVLDSGVEGLWNTGEVSEGIEVEESGTYIQSWGQAGCYTADSIEVELYPNFDFDWQEYLSLCSEEKNELILPDAPSIDYVWSTGAEGPSLEVNESGVYQLTIITACEVLEREVEIEVSECWPYVYVPSAFTPDGDGINDYWRPEVFNITQYKVEVYNRWGEIIFQSQNPEEYWLGEEDNGRQYVATRLYSYRLTYLDPQGTYREKIGSIHMLR